MFKINKQFELCYAHRVWKQELDPALSDNSACKCKHNHGHNSIVTVELEGDKLNPQGMLLDYVNLNWFKKFIDDNLDHKTILDRNDPWAVDFVNSTRPSHLRVGSVTDALIPGEVNGVIQFCKVETNSPHAHHREVANGLVLVEFVPTSENLCRWLYYIVNHKLSNICKVSSVSFSETPKTLATFSA